MKIAVIGAGAMGSIYAARFALAGHSVVAVDPWEAHIKAINADGLSLDGPDGHHIVTGIIASGNADVVRDAELIIVATKASAVGAAASAIREFVGPETSVLTIQNGLGAGAGISRCLPPKACFLGVADGFGASMVGPGHVHHTAMKLIRLGELSGGSTPRLRAMEAVWQGAGFKAQAYEDIHQLIWEKLLCNVTLSAPCAVFNCTVGELLGDPDRWSVAIACGQEAYACGLAEGISFSFDDPVAYITKFAELVAGASPSMRLDHMAKRRSEIDFINGAIPPLGRKHGIVTPRNDEMTKAVHELEAAFAGRNT
ncbi:ketopantoate reductase family protein [Roseovarius sp. ZX-A-9]|uniref:ketopantoate reductase family protein n=1 Tax=Roseovarius sp. ZX-A-9 TaxID=3014783 RepID=UPI00232B33B4|nr:2-dehydropantoate 2-reductase [Roseovarius sp. ZX-A-9]